MDALSEALASVRMTGAIFYHAECTAPWEFRVPPLQDVAHVLAPGTERLVSYHLVTHGKAIVCFSGAKDIPVTAGDILIIPHGDAHTVSNGSPSTLLDSGASLGKYSRGRSHHHAIGRRRRNDPIRLRLFRLRTSCRKALPRRPAADHQDQPPRRPGRRMAGDLVPHLVSQAGSARPGQSVLLSKMAEALFIETIRRYMEALPPEQTGWLAGARDPVVGGALALLHRKPCHHWAVEELAAETGVSRSVLAERFSGFSANRH